ncbi:MAG: hypothetical protein Q8Q31_02655 [Nanoarchaeota archaeon]|nr:hypothetical protein [Nanoarchaeota archaeon]
MGILRYCLETKGPMETLTKGAAIMLGAYLGWKIGDNAVFAAEYFSGRVSSIDYAIRESPLITKLGAAVVTAGISGFAGKFPGRLVDYLNSNSK